MSWGTQESHWRLCGIGILRGSSTLLFLRQRLLQIIRGFADCCRDIFQHLADYRDLGISFLPFFLIHVFTNRCNRLGPVTGVGTGSIDLMLEPWTLRQTFLG